MTVCGGLKAGRTDEPEGILFEVTNGNRGLSPIARANDEAKRRAVLWRGRLSEMLGL